MILDGKRDSDRLYTYTDAINNIPRAYMRGGTGMENALEHSTL